MVDLISVGMVTVDLFYRGASLTQKEGRFQLAVGGKYFTDGFHMNIGGGAFNVASHAQENGIRVILAAQYSQNEFTSFITHKLNSMRIDYSLSSAMTGFENISSILVTEKGERTIINYRTSHQHLLSYLEKTIEHVPSRSLYLANLPDIDFDERIRFLRKRKEKGMLIFSNLGVTDCRRSHAQIDAYLKTVDILIINTHECADLIKKPHEVIDFHNNIKKIYFPHQEKCIVVVTAGKDGSWTYTNDRVYHEKALHVEYVVDTTGAGDAYTAGFISHFLKSGIVEDAMKQGSKTAASVISRLGSH